MVQWEVPSSRGWRRRECLSHAEDSLTEGKLWLWALGLLLKVKAWLPVRGFPLLLSVVLLCGELGRDVRGEMLCLAINSRVAKGFL